jgi:hypothetical protein
MKMRDFNKSEQRSLAAAIAYQGILRLKIAVPSKATGKLVSFE